MIMTTDDLWEKNFADHLDVAQATRAGLFEPFERLLSISLEAVRDGGKLLFFGNGGSAADAQHLATELTVRYVNDRPPLPAIALSTDTSADRQSVVQGKRVDPRGRRTPHTTT